MRLEIGGGGDPDDAAVAFWESAARAGDEVVDERRETYGQEQQAGDSEPDVGELAAIG